MAHRVTFFPRNVSVEIPDGETVLDAAIAAGVQINSVCGGEGTCGKCQIIVEGPHKAERGPLDDQVWSRGYRLACRTLPEGDLSVFVPEESQVRVGKIMTSYRDLVVHPAGPLVDTLVAEMSAPSIEDHLADMERLRCALERPDLDIALPALRELPVALRSGNWKVMAKVARAGTGDCIIKVRPAVNGCHDLGAAVDIGTTTVAIELIDLHTGRTVAQASDYNRQLVAGEDVLARIAYAEDRGVGRLQELIIGTINQLVSDLCALRNAQEDLTCQIRADEIMALSVGGNTAMIHMLLGLDPRNIRYEPYIPITHGPPVLKASELGLNIHPLAPVYCIPGRASYVGGDVTADVLLSGMHRKDELALLIDVGTNGEVVLGNRDWMLTCSTSAGPAFEGGEVSCGMRATAGAIERVRMVDQNIDYTTIGRTAPRGICGSGLIDLVAQMFLNGHLDRKGHIQAEGSELARSTGKVVKFVIHTGEREIAITDDDIANIIRTKAAIYAGCSVLIDSVGMSFNDVDRVYIAGGFGGHIDIGNAQLIGLLPDLPRERFEFIGNGSLGGAKMCLISEESRKEAAGIFDAMTYLDLSSSHEFFDQYSSALFLPHTDMDQFPSVRRMLER
ncbi:MAG: DUF4445 domain-containing protein [Euryarchaeota archaeon]|nr:DUF4445 domain-containing protein [Euryarchaeota archaeon]